MAKWRPIPGFEGYEASDEGEVRSVDRSVPYGSNGHTRAIKGKLLTPYVLDGYLRVGLNIRGKRKQVFVHRLVLLAWKGVPKSEDMQGGHGPDSDRMNNRPDNLQWQTRDWNQVEMNERNYRPLTYDPMAFLQEEAEVDAQAKREGWDGSHNGHARDTDEDEAPF